MTEQGIVFVQLCNVLDPGVGLEQRSNELRTATQALLPQLKADHEVATALCLKVGLRSCKVLCEATTVNCYLLPREKGVLANRRTYLGRSGKPRRDGGSTSGPPSWLRSSLVSAPARTSPRTRVTTLHTHTE